MSATNTIKPYEVVISLYDYHNKIKPNAGGEEVILSFQKDTIIYVLDNEEGDWRDGVVFTKGVQLKRGWFPINYCKKIEIINNNYYYQEQLISSSNLLTHDQLESIVTSATLDNHLEVKKSGIRLIRNVIRYQFSNHRSGGFGVAEDTDDTIYTLEKNFKAIYYPNLNKYVFYNDEDLSNISAKETIKPFSKEQEFSIDNDSEPEKDPAESESSTRKPSDTANNTSFQFPSYFLNDPNLFFINETRNIENYEYLLQTIQFYLKCSKEAIVGKENYSSVSSNCAGTIQQGDHTTGKLCGFLNNDIVNWKYLKYHKGSYYDFTYNLNIVSKHILLMQTALRIYSNDKNMHIHRRTRKKIKQLLKLLNQFSFTISVNTYLYFNSEKFALDSEKIDDSLSGSVTELHDKRAPGNWKEQFSWNPDPNVPLSTKKDESNWASEEVDPKFKEGFKRNSSAGTLKLQTDTNIPMKRQPSSVENTTQPKQSFVYGKKFSKFNLNPSITSSNFLSSVSNNGVHIDFLIKSIFEAYNSYEIVLNKIFQFLIHFQKQNNNQPSSISSTSIKPTNNNNSSNPKMNYILQLTPHFLKDSLDRNYWDNLCNKEASSLASFSGSTLLSESQLNNLSVSSAKPQPVIDFFGLDKTKTSKFSFLSPSSSDTAPNKSKSFVTKNFVKKFNQDLMIIIAKTNHAVTIFEEPQTTERDINFVYCVSNVLRFNANLLKKFENLDFELYRYLVAIDFNATEDGTTEYKELNQWKKYLLDSMRLVLLDYSEAKQKFHEMVSLGVLYTQQICFQDPFVFSSMRKDYFYDDNAVVKNYNPLLDKTTKRALDDDALPIFRNINGGSSTTLNFMGGKYHKTNSTPSLLSLQKTKRDTLEMVLSLLTRQMIFEDVETNTADFINPVELLKSVMKDFLNNFNQLIDIVDQIASITDSFFSSALSFINNPKVANLVNIVSSLKEAALANEEREYADDDALADFSSKDKGELSKNSTVYSLDNNSDFELYQPKKNVSGSYFELQKTSEDNIGKIVLNPNYAKTKLMIPGPNTKLKRYFEADEESNNDDWLLQNEYEDFLIYEQKTGQVQAGTKLALVEHLTSHISTDPWFNEVMFQNFKTIFSSTFEFFNMILIRYNLLPQEGLNYREYDLWVKKKLNVVKLSCYLVLFEFLECYWYPQYLENDLLRFNHFLEVFKEDKMPNLDKFSDLFNKKIVEPLRANISDKSFKNKDTDAMSKKYAARVVSSHLFLWKSEDKLCPTSFNLFSFSAATMAANLTLKEFDMFKNISSLECLSRVLNNKHTWQGGSPNIKAFINMSNLITNFIVYEIVKDIQASSRAKTIERCIDIVEELFALNNFSAMTSIISALSASPVFRLKNTWALVSPDYKEKFSRFFKVMDSNKNFNVYRDLFNAVKLKKPALPFFGVYLSDLIFTQMGNANLVKVSRISEPLINFNKRAKLQIIIKEIKQLQQVNYDNILEMDNDCMWFIETYCYKDPEHVISKKDNHYVPDMDHLYAQSLIIEPKSPSNTTKTIKNINLSTPMDRETFLKKNEELKKSHFQSKNANNPSAVKTKNMFVIQDNLGTQSENSSIDTNIHPNQHLRQNSDFARGADGSNKFALKNAAHNMSFSAPSESTSDLHSQSKQKNGNKKSVLPSSQKQGHDKNKLNILSSKKTKTAAFNKLMHYEK